MCWGKMAANIYCTWWFIFQENHNGRLMENQWRLFSRFPTHLTQAPSAADHVHFCQISMASYYGNCRRLASSGKYSHPTLGISQITMSRPSVILRVTIFTADCFTGNPGYKLSGSRNYLSTNSEYLGATCQVSFGDRNKYRPAPRG